MRVHYLSGSGFDGNIYLIESQRPILIDTGTGRYVDNAINNIKKIVDPKKIETILLTHRHFDHVGGAHKLKKSLGAKLYIYLDDAPPLTKGDEVSTGARDFGGSLPKLDVNVLTSDSVIDCGDVELEVIHTPGHTIGSASFYEPKNRSIFVGDTVFTNGGVGRWDLETGSYTQLLSSLKKLAGMDIVNLYPGHGMYIEGRGKEHIIRGLKNLEEWGF